MKKSCIVVALLLLVGCGGGDSSSSPQVFNGTGAPPLGSGGDSGVPSGTHSAAVAVNITDETLTAADEKSAQAAPAATNLRLVITNAGVRFSNGSTYKVILDGNFVSSIQGLSFPVANNYHFQLVTYKPGGSPTLNRMLKYAEALVNITPSGAVVNLTVTPIANGLSNFALPATVYSPQSFVINPTIAAASPLTSRWNLFVGTTPTTSTTPLACPFSVAFHSTTPGHAGGVRVPLPPSSSPLSLPPGATMCAQGEFFIKDSLLDTSGTGFVYDTSNPPVLKTPHPPAESFLNWTFNYPNPDNDPAISATWALVGVPPIGTGPNP
jgi:hypothetical protein